MSSLSTVFRRALLNVSKASNLPTIQDETQVAKVLFPEMRFVVELGGPGINRFRAERLS